MGDPPLPLGPDGAAKWAELVGKVQGQTARKPSVLTDLAAYCVAFDRWCAAERWLADPEHGPVITIRDDKGNIKSHGPAPQLAISERASKEMTRLARGLRV